MCGVHPSVGQNIGSDCAKLRAPSQLCGSYEINGLTACKMTEINGLTACKMTEINGLTACKMTVMTKVSKEYDMPSNDR